VEERDKKRKVQREGRRKGKKEAEGSGMRQ